MKKVYVIQLPWMYSPRIMAFDTEDLAQEVADALNKDKGASSLHDVHVFPLIIYKIEEIKSNFLKTWVPLAEKLE